MNGMRKITVTIDKAPVNPLEWTHRIQVQDYLRPPKVTLYSDADVTLRDISLADLQSLFSEIRAAIERQLRAIVESTLGTEEITRAIEALARADAVLAAVREPRKELDTYAVPFGDPATGPSQKDS